MEVVGVGSGKRDDSFGLPLWAVPTPQSSS